MNLKKHFERQIARWIETVSRAAAAEGLHTTTERALGEIRVQIRHPDGPMALVATFTSPPAAARRVTTPDEPPAQVTLDEVIRRREEEARKAAEQQAEAPAPVCLRCRGTQRVDILCDYPGCRDSGDDHACNDGRGPCPECAPPKPEAPPRPEGPSADDDEPAAPAPRWLYGLSVGTLADLSDDGLAALEAAGLPDFVLSAPCRASGLRYRGWWFARPVESTDALYTWAAAWKVSLLTANVDDAQLAAHIAAASVAPPLPARLARTQDVIEQAAKLAERNGREIKRDAKAARDAKKPTKKPAPKDETTRGAKASKKLPKGTKGAR